MASKEIINAKWINNMAFEAEVNGHKIVLDAESHVGGEDRGPRPKPLMLLALGGCTAMDVISILKKMRVEVEDFKVHVSGDLTEEHPKYYYKIHTVYEFTGSNLPMDKIEKAINLSEERYCGVTAVYRKVIEMTSEIKINKNHS